MLPKVSKNILKEKSNNIKKTFNLYSFLLSVFIIGTANASQLDLEDSQELINIVKDKKEFVLNYSINNYEVLASHRSHRSHSSHRSHRSSSYSSSYSPYSTSSYSSSSSSSSTSSYSSPVSSTSSYSGKQVNKTTKTEKKYSLYIDAPKDTEIKIMNSKIRYSYGVKLKKGVYTIRLKKVGYVTEDFRIELNKDTHCKFKFNNIMSFQSPCN